MEITLIWMVPIHINAMQLQCDFGEGNIATLVWCSTILCAIDFNGNATKSQLHAFMRSRAVFPPNKSPTPSNMCSFQAESMEKRGKKADIKNRGAEMNRCVAIRVSPMRRNLGVPDAALMHTTGKIDFWVTSSFRLALSLLGERSEHIASR